jgi:hypothetical protein
VTCKNDCKNELKRLRLEEERAYTAFLLTLHGSTEESVAYDILTTARYNLRVYKERGYEKTEPTFTPEPVMEFLDDFGDVAAVSASKSANPSALDTQVDGDHYNKRAIQPIEFIAANGLNFFEGSIVKYITRWSDKGGVKDLNKIKHYIDLLIELESKYGDINGTTT